MKIVALIFFMEKKEKKNKMANTTAKKSMGKKTIVNQEKEVKATTIAVGEVKETEETVKETVREPKTYAPTDAIWTTSVTAGQLIMIGKKTKTLYSWADCGDTTEVEYQDLMAAKLSKDSYIFSPLFVIDDEELLDSKGWENVKKVYEGMCSIGEIEAMFQLDPAQFKQALERLPKGLIPTVKSIAAEKIENKTLDSLNKINILDEVLGTDLKLYL